MCKENINSVRNFSSLISSVGIEIPLIQRDYVQGRIHDMESIKKRHDDEAKSLLKKYTDEKEKRDKFVRALVAALRSPETSALQLTFIYGTVETTAASDDRHSKSFVPLDGQQRLTTLFLLSWVLWLRAGKECDVAGYSDFIKGMKSVSYKTRPSSGKFCSSLFTEELKEVEGLKLLSDRIRKQSWFGDDWMLDPSVQAMLQMVDQMDKEIPDDEPSTIKQMFNNLVEGKGIEFELLDMKDYQLTDGLYIKMNARGKQLTKFENWKSEFIGFIENKFPNTEYEPRKKQEIVFGTGNPKLKEYFEYSIEHQWTDLFWPYCVEEIEAAGDEECYPVIDDFFMRCFYAIHQLFYFINRKSNNVNEFQDTVAQREETFGDVEKVKELFDYLDLLKEFNDCGIYDKLFFVETGNQYSHPEDKVRLFDGKNLNLLTRCAQGKDFTNMAQIVLYGMLRYAKEFGTEVTSKFRAFVRRVRNEAEGNVGLRTESADVVSTLQICDIYSIKEKIDKWIDQCRDGNLPKVSSGYVEIDDFDFVCGNLKPDLLSDLEAELVAEVLKAWDALVEEYDKIALLVGYGYKGLYVMTCANGDAYLLGNNDRWRALFMRDKSLEAPLRAIISDYSKLQEERGASALKSLLDRKKSDVPSNFGFSYYVLQYREFVYSHAKEKGARQYFAINGDRDSLNISSIVYSSNPVRAYYTNPVVFVVKEELCGAEKSEGRTKLYLGYSRRYAGMASLYVYDSLSQDVDSPIGTFQQIPESYGKGGWKFINHSTGQEPCPKKDVPKKDRIVAGVDFVRSIYPDCDFYEK